MDTGVKCTSVISFTARSTASVAELYIALSFIFDCWGSFLVSDIKFTSNFLLPSLLLKLLQIIPTCRSKRLFQATLFIVSRGSNWLWLFYEQGRGIRLSDSSQMPL